MKNKILLIEDDLGLALPLKEFLEDNGLLVIHTADGNESIPLYKKERPGLILLDIMLPNKNGFEIISEIRQIDDSTPVILVTGTEFNPESEIKGYELGAINYMKKPILPQAILALAKNLLLLPEDLKQYKLGKYLIRVHSQYVEINDGKHRLREKDAAVLNILLDRKNLIVPRKTILKRVWLDDSPEKNNILDSSILRLRRLFEAYEDIQIRTVYGNGYIMEAR